MLALELNCDFTSFGVSAGLANSITNLVLNDSTSPVNGKTVKQILGIANLALGGGNVSSYGVTVASLSTLVDSLNRAFDGCQPNAWAYAHLLPASAVVQGTGMPTSADNADPKPMLNYF